MNRTDFFRFLCRIFCRIFAGLTSKMIRPDFDRTGQTLKLAGPDQMQKIRLVPTLDGSSWKGSFFEAYNHFHFTKIISMQVI
jgi:hypothetical protein